MELFEEFPRSYNGITTPGEGTFAFMNRSAWDECNLTRETLNAFFRRYPAGEQTEMKAKLQSTTQFSSAFFELFSHELLLRLGFHVLVHPELEGTTKRPDFLANSASTDVIVEAKVATNQSDEERSRDARLQVLYHKIDEKIRSPHFFLCLGPMENPDRVPPPREIVNFIGKFVEDLERARSAMQSVPPHLIRWPVVTVHGEGGFSLEIAAIAKSAEAAARPD
jgi:hypothetical protein